MSDVLFAAAIDASIRLALAALAVEWSTRRLRRCSPAAAHALWMLVLLAALAFVAGGWLVTPKGYVHPAGDLARFFPARGLDGVWRARVLILYAAGLLVALLRLGVGLALIRALVRRSAPIGATDRANLIPADLRLRRRVSLHETGDLSIPVTVGFLQPRVLLPADWRGWPAERLRAVLRHELAHVARGDYLAGLAAAVVQAVLWFHPAAWLAGARASLCAELACDRIARATCPPDAYAAHLLAIAARPAPPLRYGWSVGAATALAERIDSLLDTSGGPPVSPRVAILACGALVTLLLAATPLRLVPLRWTSSGSTLSAATPAHPWHHHSH